MPPCAGCGWENSDVRRRCRNCAAPLEATVYNTPVPKCWRCEIGETVSDDFEHWGEGELVYCRRAEILALARASSAPPAPAEGD